MHTYDDVHNLPLIFNNQPISSTADFGSVGGLHINGRSDGWWPVISDCPFDIHLKIANGDYWHIFLELDCSIL